MKEAREVREVWILFESYDYEGETVLGVFASKAAAVEEAYKLEDPEHPSRVSYPVRGPFEVKG